MGLYNRLMGVPWVYDHIRPLIVGGLDLSPVYALPGGISGEVILDVGCGTGDALDYVEGFKAYHGFDPDTRAVDYLCRHRMAANVFAYDRILTAEDVVRIRPTIAFCVGVFHHLDSREVVDVLDVLAAGDSVRQVRTLDVHYLKGARVNNLVVRLDRGQYIRSGEALEALMSQSPFQVTDRFRFRPRIPLLTYFVMDLQRRDGKDG